MKGPFFLTSRYLWFNKYRALLISFSLGILIFLPFGLEKLTRESERRMMARARTSPLIIGTKGSPADLVLNSLYFKTGKIDFLKFSAFKNFSGSEFGKAVPLLVGFKAREFPIVGTNIDYFEERGIEISKGKIFGYLGECIIGANVAKNTGLGIGEYLISSPEGFFDFAGVYPLKMKISGILVEKGTPDDHAVFTDIKTTWIIQGLGHGHQDLTGMDDPTIVIEKNDSVMVAGSKLMMYNELDEKNRGSFHFHGDMDSNPISSVLFFPNDQKSEAIIRGKFEAGEYSEQIVVPKKIISNLLSSVFRLKKIFAALYIAVLMVSACIMGLLILLTLRLRKDEFDTFFILGARRFLVTQMAISEVFLTLLMSFLFAAVFYQISGFFVNDFMDQMILI